MYAVAKRLSPTNMVNVSKVTLPWKYAISDPPRPAMNDPIAKEMSFTRTTSMPAPAAERSLARTASISEPSRLVRSSGHADGHADEHQQHEEPELDAGGSPIRPGHGGRVRTASAR